MHVLAGGYHIFCQKSIGELFSHSSLSFLHFLLKLKDFRDFCPMFLQKCILKNAEKLIELCVAKLSQDWFPLLELLAMVLNPQCK